jgi:hypothetical protein
MSVVPAQSGANVRSTTRPNFETTSHTQLQPLGAPDPTALQKARVVLAQPVVASFVAGGVAGAVSRTVVSPLERLKILFQVQSVGREEYKMSVPKALAKMWREEGWRGFMAGNGTNCIRIVPYSAVQFSAYNVYKRVSSSLSPYIHFAVPSTVRYETCGKLRNDAAGYGRARGYVAGRTAIGSARLSPKDLADCQRSSSEGTIATR